MLPCVTRAKSPVFYAPGADPAILAASERARATFKYLWRELTWEYRRIIPALELAAVKAAFGDEGGHPDEVEHMTGLRDRARSLAEGGDDVVSGVARDVAAHAHWSWGFYRLGPQQPPGTAREQYALDLAGFE